MLAGRRAQLPDAENIDDLVRLNLIRQQARVIEQQHQREHAADVEIRPRVRRSAQLRPLGSVAEPEQNRDVDFAAVTRRRERLPRGIRPGGLDVMLAQRAAQRNGDA